MPEPRQIETAAEMQRYSREQHVAGRTIALVPTMGYLHDGHLSLVERASGLADRVVVSIYVNPTQFGPSEDLDSYPRDVEGDFAKLRKHNVDVVLLPPNSEMYPTGFATEVAVSGLTAGLCGSSRPVHFAGVATIVTKLLNIVQPDYAVFGQKDYQQLQVIRRLVKDLNIPVEIVGSPTIRESDGLAKSSRNAYLSADQRSAAAAIYSGLCDARTLFLSGERHRDRLLEAARRTIEAQDCLRIDYLELVHPTSLTTFEAISETLPDSVHMATAVFAGKTRLIDNMRLSNDE